MLSGKFSFWSQPESHSASTIVEFIEKAVEHSKNGKFHYFLQTDQAGQAPIQVSLLYPISRFQRVQSLLHMCRFEILSNVRRDHVDQLPLPVQIKNYLRVKQYYAENLEDFAAEEPLADLTPATETLEAFVEAHSHHLREQQRQANAAGGASANQAAAVAAAGLLRPDSVHLYATYGRRS